MAIPEYDNVKKWGNFFRGLPFWLKGLIVGGIVSVAAIWLYTQFGPMRQLKKENKEIRSKLSQAETEISTLRDRKDELHRENIHLKDLIAPIQRRAEQLYPEMETAAAIAKLSEDLELLRSLATKDVYRPLADKNLRQLIVSLEALHQAYPSISPYFSIGVQQGNSTRHKIADDLKKYLIQAGFSAEVRSQMSFYKGIPPDISIKIHPEDLEFAQKLTGIIGSTFINEQFAGVKSDKIERGHFKITINGEPLFTEAGVVTFR